MQLRYAITLFHRKLTSHRWDSVPKRCLSHTPHWKRPAMLSHTSLWAAAQLHFRFQTTML